MHLKLSSAKMAAIMSRGRWVKYTVASWVRHIIQLRSVAHMDCRDATQYIPSIPQASLSCQPNDEWHAK